MFFDYFFPLLQDEVQLAAFLLIDLQKIMGDYPSKKPLLELIQCNPPSSIFNPCCAKYLIFIFILFFWL
jgi:hypothetical protein